MDASANFHPSFHASIFTSMKENLLPWKQIVSMETSMEVSGYRFTYVEISMEAGGSTCASMEVSGSFHGNTWKFPLSVEV